MGSKSWDVQRRPASSAPSRAPRPVERMRASSSQTVVRKERPDAVVARRSSTALRTSGKKEVAAPLRERRRKQRQRFLITLLVLIILLFAGALYALWLPAFRIQNVQASGPDSQDVESLARAQMTGRYAFIFPLDSVLFVPQKEMRASILNTHLDIQAVSISATGLNTLSIQALPRASAFWWCGESADTSDGTCYEVGAEGLLFEPVASGLLGASTTASTTTVAARPSLLVYAPLATSTRTVALGSSIASSSAIPGALRFVKAMKDLGVNVVSLTLRDDEADVYAASCTDCSSWPMT